MLEELLDEELLDLADLLFKYEPNNLKETFLRMCGKRTCEFGYYKMCGQIYNYINSNNVKLLNNDINNLTISKCPYLDDNSTKLK